MTAIKEIRRKPSPMLGVKLGFVKGSWSWELDQMKVEESRFVDRKFTNSLRASIATNFNSIEGGKRFSTTVKASEGVPEGKIKVTRTL